MKLTQIVQLTLFVIVSSIIFPNEKIIVWSEYQGKMGWGTANSKCESIGMRLPNIQELKIESFFKKICYLQKLIRELS